MKRSLLRVETKIGQDLSVGFVRNLSDPKIKDDTHAFAMFAKSKENEMERVMKELEKLQVEYLQGVEDLLKRAFQMRFGKALTTLEAVDCRVDHVMNGDSTYYYNNKPFLIVEQGELEVKEEGNKMTATLPLKFQIITGEPGEL